MTRPLCVIVLAPRDPWRALRFADTNEPADVTGAIARWCIGAEVRVVGPLDAATKLAGDIEGTLRRAGAAGVRIEVAS